MSRKIGIGDLVLLSIENNSYRYQISSLTPQINIVDPNNSSNKGIIINVQGEWKIFGLNCPHTLTFTPKEIYESLKSIRSNTMLLLIGSNFAPTKFCWVLVEDIQKLLCNFMENLILFLQEQLSQSQLVLLLQNTSGPHTFALFGKDGSLHTVDRLEQLCDFPEIFSYEKILDSMKNIPSSKEPNRYYCIKVEDKFTVKNF